MTELGAVREEPSRRSHILRAALGSFAEHGYAATTIDAIRRRAGASVGSMYHHFAGKEALAATLLVDGRRAHYAAWIESLVGRRSASTGIRAAVRAHFEWLAANADLGRFTFGFDDPTVLGSVRAELHGVRAGFQRNLLAWLGPHVEAGEVKHLPDDVYEPLWIGPSLSFTRQWLEWDELGELVRFHRDFADAAWDALRRR